MSLGSGGGLFVYERVTSEDVEPVEPAELEEDNCTEGKSGEELGDDLESESRLSLLLLGWRYMLNFAVAAFIGEYVIDAESEPLMLRLRTYPLLFLPESCDSTSDELVLRASIPLFVAVDRLGGVVSVWL